MSIGEGSGGGLHGKGNGRAIMAIRATHLARHNLRVDAGDFDARVEAGSVMRFHHGTSEDLVRANPAVVGPLRRRPPALRPSCTTQRLLHTA